MVGTDSKHYIHMMFHQIPQCVTLELAKTQILRTHPELLNKNLQDEIHTILKNMALDLDMETNILLPLPFVFPMNSFFS